jgi:hypothetical protein
MMTENSMKMEIYVNNEDCMVEIVDRHECLIGEIHV